MRSELIASRASKISSGARNLNQMKSFLVVSNSEEKTKDWVTNTLAQHSIDRFDVTVVRQDATKTTTGIDQVRSIQKSISLKPIRGTNKAVVLYGAQILTVEAQNALLKTLEEPPEDTIIVLTTNKKDLLLPTILSRCTIVDLGFAQVNTSEDKEFQSLIHSMQKWGIGESLKKAQDLAKDKQEAIAFLEKMILVAREELFAIIYSSNEARSLKDSSSLRQTADRTIEYYHVLITSFQKTHRILSTTNVNPRLALENMFLSLQYS